MGQVLSAARAGDAAFDVMPDEFRWVEMPGAFKCGNALANGCFSHGGFGTATISWNTQTITVIRHEAQHAILWKLKHPDAKCVEHDC